MTDNLSAPDRTGAAPSADTARVEAAAQSTAREDNRVLGLLSSGVGRNAGLVLAFVILCVVGAATAGDRFTTADNALTILRLAATTGVVSIGMTFVITAGQIDLSVGAILALSSVWCTTLATQQLAQDTHWVMMVLVALAVGAGCGLINGILVAYGGIVSFIATLAMLASARGLAEIISNRRTQIVQVPDFVAFFDREILGIEVQVYIFVLVAIGLTVPRFAIEIARQRLTPAYFSRAVMTAEMFAPEEAVTAGFFDRVVAADQLEPLDAVDPALRLDRFDARALGVIGSDNELAAAAVRNAMRLAEIVQHAVAARAEPRPQRAGRVIHAGVDDFGIA